MDARLDTSSDELCQVNTCVGRIARCQTKIGGYTMPSTPVASTDESDGFDSADDADNVDATTPMMRMMAMLAHLAMTRCLLDTFTLCHSWQKVGVVLGMRVVIIRRRVNIGDFWQGECSYWGM